MCVAVCAGGALGPLLQHPPAYSLKTGSLTKPGGSWQPVSMSNPVSTLLAEGLQACTWPHPAFLSRFWKLELGVLMLAQRASLPTSHLPTP